MGGVGNNGLVEPCYLCGEFRQDVELVELPVGPVVDGDRNTVPTPACSGCADLYTQDRELERAELAMAAANEQRLDERRERGR